MENTALKTVPATNNITVYGGELKEALKFVEPGISSEATRYYLNTVYFDKQVDKPLYLVTTDGHRLHKIALKVNGNIDALEFTFLLPYSAVKSLIKQLEKRELYALNFEGETLSINGGITQSFKACDAKFPDYPRLIPAGETPATLAAYNAKYLAAAFKSFAALGHGIAISSYGSGDPLAPIKLQTTSDRADALIVLMPMRV